MAFDKTPAAAGTNNNNNINGIPANKKAIGFLNFYLPTEGGGKRKIGNTGIPLREANANERALAEWLAVDPEARTALMKGTLIVEYNSAEPAEGGGFMLPTAE